MYLVSRTVFAPGWQLKLRSAGGLDQIEGVYESAAGKVITRTASCEVRQIEVGSGAEATTIFIKKYWVNRWAQLWKGMFRGTFFGQSKARREFENLNRLRGWQLDAPAALAYGEQRVAGWLVRSFLISEAVPHGVPLQVFIRERSTSQNAPESKLWRTELIQNLATSTRRLHGYHFVHHDYFWRNILLSGSSLKKFFLIDSHKGRRWFPGEAALARARDLAALDSPATAFFRRTERLRFFLLYLGQPRLDARAKSLLRLILRQADPMRDEQIFRALFGGAPSQKLAPTSAS